MEIVLGQGSPVATVEPTPVRSDARLEALAGFTAPIEGGCLPSSDLVMPNASREYRNGVHEGVDFYDGDSCVPVGRGTDVVAALDGVVVRADWDYRDLTSAEAAVQDSTEESLDRFRGRQVWIDHGMLAETGERVITRYAHLDSIEEGIDVGDEVSAGQIIAHVGNSGTPEGVTDPNAELHLHFEVRVGDRFLGEGEPPDVVREAYERLFS
ncbi:MAG TPA: M23 family metallopeptidase [Dehalococcoidia bacterium]|nr:M23 family metallopeptidase [Dehalococcoidia bacterium]